MVFGVWDVGGGRVEGLGQIFLEGIGFGVWGPRMLFARQFVSILWTTSVCKEKTRNSSVKRLAASSRSPFKG